jgi:hypothetical protein
VGNVDRRVVPRFPTGRGIDGWRPKLLGEEQYLCEPEAFRHNAGKQAVCHRAAVDLERARVSVPHPQHYVDEEVPRGSRLRGRASVVRPHRLGHSDVVLPDHFEPLVDLVNGGGVVSVDEASNPSARPRDCRLDRSPLSRLNIMEIEISMTNAAVLKAASAWKRSWDRD